MPNAPKTPTRTFRIPQELWEDLKKMSLDKETTSSAIVVQALKEYIEKNKPQYGEWQ